MSSSIVFSYPTRSLKLARGHQICSGTTFVKSLGFHRHSLTSSVVNIGYVRKSNSRAFVLTKAGNDDEQDVGDMFQRELEKRNISSIDDIKDSPRGRDVVAPPAFASELDQDDSSQLQRSRELNSEGLEGLIPRGSQLLQLGASFFLAFGPFILFVLVSFGAVYSLFGDLFVHSGSPSSGVPQYIDPMDLLSEPTVDPMIPM